MENETPTVLVRPTDVTFSSFIERPYLDAASRERLRGANVLIAPQEGYGEREDLVYFPSGSRELYRYLLDNRPEEIRVDICIEDRDFKELSLHADWVNLPTLVVTCVVGPIVLNLISSYIYDALRGRAAKAQVKSRVIVVDEENGKHVEVTYEGPAETYRDVVTEALQHSRPGAPPLPRASRRHRRRK